MAAQAAGSVVMARAVACAFCRRRLAGEYYFTCLRCDASCCYIHMFRHQPAACARRGARSRRVTRIPVPTQAGIPLLTGSPSANV